MLEIYDINLIQVVIFSDILYEYTIRITTKVYTFISPPLILLKI